MNIHTEFTDFDNLPAFDAASAILSELGFQDSSYGNDGCPSLSLFFDGKDAERIAVWIDYADPSRREFGQDQPTFTAAHYPEDGEMLMLAESDSLCEVLSVVIHYARSL